MQAPEIGFSFLVKDRFLDEQKLQWIRDNVKKRECSGFITPQQMEDLLYRGLMRVDTEQNQNDLCRCGKERREHSSEVLVTSRMTDYRLISEKVPTDVFLEIVHSSASQVRPVTYSPRQVIRLAADTEPDVLGELTSQVWHLPKSSFLVNVYGAWNENTGSDVDFCMGLQQLLATLSNPGGVMLTISDNDPELYRLVLNNYTPSVGQQLPYAEITPVAFLQWRDIPDDHKQVLMKATVLGSRVEHSEVDKDALYSLGHKGYFLLTDYGVYADVNAVKRKENEKTERVAHEIQPAANCITVQPDGSAVFSQPGLETSSEGQELTKETEAERVASDPQPTTNSANECCRWEEGPGKISKDQEELASQTNTLLTEIGEERQQAHSDDDPACGESGSGVTLQSVGEPSDEIPLNSNPDRQDVPDSTHLTHTKVAQPIETCSMPPIYGSDDNSAIHTFSEIISAEGEEPEQPTKKFKLLKYPFPHPLRRSMETLLRGHTYDSEGHGSVMIVCGASSFVDLAAVHGAVRSGVPVVFLKGNEEKGATAMLLALMDELDQDQTDEKAEFMNDMKESNVPTPARLTLAINNHKKLLDDLEPCKQDLTRVVKDLLWNRHLLTVCNPQRVVGAQDSVAAAEPLTLVDAVVEGFVKARTEEEAVTFFEKNTLKVAGEPDNHPVKKAQRIFQRATLLAAVKLDRPELLEVVHDRGFVQLLEVFRNCEVPQLPPRRYDQIMDLDEVPFKEIKHLYHFEARERFVKRVCNLNRKSNIVTLSRDAPITHMTVLHRLFLHAVLNGRTRMAKHFWRSSMFQDQVTHALIASRLSCYMADKLLGGPKALCFRQQAEEFDGLAKGTLNQCYLLDAKKAIKVVAKADELFSISPIEAAVSFGQWAFVAEPAASDFLDVAWKQTDLTEPSQDAQTRTHSRLKMWDSVKAFIKAPRTKCFVSTVLYVVFLALYGHMLMFESGGKQLSALDIVLLVWAVAFLQEEISQMIVPSNFLMTRRTGNSVKDKLNTYFSDHWNIIDLTALFFFALGYILRVSLQSPEAGHIILSLVYVIFFIRILRVLVISRTIGPMLPMIWNMLGDFVPFLVILFVFVFAYSVASEAILHPDSSWHALHLLHLPRVAFWPIFGDYEYQDSSGADCKQNPQWYAEHGGVSTCPSRAGRHVVPVLMGMYILVTNVLMMNLLIAYFNHSFEAVYTKSNVWWAWLRCGLIGEYRGRSILPAPFCALRFVLWAAHCLFCCCCYCCLMRKKQRASGLHIRRSKYSMDDVSFPLLSDARCTDDVVAVHEVFNEDIDMLDALDLDEFRFSSMGRETDGRTSFAQTSLPAVTGDDSPSIHMTDLQIWEASRASLHLQASAPPSQRPKPTADRSKGDKKPSGGLVEDTLKRMEKKIEGNIERLKVLENLLKNPKTNAVHA